MNEIETKDAEQKYEVEFTFLTELQPMYVRQVGVMSVLATSDEKARQSVQSTFLGNFGAAEGFRVIRSSVEPVGRTDNGTPDDMPPPQTKFRFN